MKSVRETLANKCKLQSLNKERQTKIYIKFVFERSENNNNNNIQRIKSFA